ncbi:hypothetical protein SAMN04487981_111160 [Streptomyces sp. cf386]|nr:hypothetical protein SAMN04487981_111160 [Streptomyces sp. cf386]
MNIGHPRDVDPSITGQPHQVTGKVPDLMGNISRTLGNPVNMPAAVRILVPPQLVRAPVWGFSHALRIAVRKTTPHARVRHDGSTRTRASRQPHAHAYFTTAPTRATYAAPRCSASHTAVDSRAPSSIALPQWAIQAAMPSGVPET